MKSLFIAVLATLVFAGTTLGRNVTDAIAKVRQIKLLQSTRADIKKIFNHYEASEDKDHYQAFSNDAVRIEVTYSSGTCTDDSDEEDASEIWNVKEWAVTGIEVEPEEAVSIRDVGFTVSSFKKEPRYPDTEDSFVFHSKTTGLAFKTYENAIANFIFFPPRSSANKLCPKAAAAKGFYTRRGWFSVDQPSDLISESGPAGVHDLTLSSTELGEISKRIVSVTTLAFDPENDVLSYRYEVSAGRIIGTGAKVEWDLTEVPPGAYSITAAVDDGCGLCGKTVTKTVILR